MAITIKILKKGEITSSIVIDDLYEIRGLDGKVYNVKFVNKELIDYPSYIDSNDIKNLIKAIWK
jgi:hypothetical protein